MPRKQKAEEKIGLEYVVAGLSAAAAACARLFSLCFLWKLATKKTLMVSLVASVVAGPILLLYDFNVK